MERNLEELKQSEEEKAKAVKSAEDGAADLKRSYQELSKSLEEHEKEYQVRIPKIMGGYICENGTFLFE